MADLGRWNCGGWNGSGFRLAVAALCASLAIACGEAEEPSAVPAEPMAPRASTAKQILFGDLHVHTTYSTDAFQWSLPLFGGEGVHPPLDACDFARHCAALDFWSINDHAESLSAENWTRTKEAVRQCNALAGDPSDPELVTFLGWEWSHTGRTPADHWGHRNVIFLDTAEDRVPTRPIAASPQVARTRARTVESLGIELSEVDPALLPRYRTYAAYLSELSGTPLCEADVDVRSLPATCTDTAASPRELFKKLRNWGFPTLVIPHGTAWGIYTPPGVSWDKALANGNHDPELEALIEVYSGHGNSEEYRPWRAAVGDGTGGWRCPEPSSSFTPNCWRAGEIIRERCLGAGLDPSTCARRAAEARDMYLETGQQGFRVVPGQTARDWGDAGQCNDCFQPDYQLRPGNSVQYALTIPSSDQDAPAHFRPGFIGSSDNHSGRPGTGYKEFGRLRMADNVVLRDELAYRRQNPIEDPEPRALPVKDLAFAPGGNTERSSSFFYTGGLAAAHSAGRDRHAIWNALRRREVYATSGPRILLWFDLINAPESEATPSAPMGSIVQMDRPPRFRVRATGALRQKPGCPESSLAALGEQRLELLCMNECYFPSDERHALTRIEVIRIRPQSDPGNPVEDSIEDPWQVLPCAPEASGCEVEFDDPEFTSDGRDSLYYVRAIQEPTPAVNGAQLRCQRNAEGVCVDVQPCYGDLRGDEQDSCLADIEERAWSSPIYVQAARSAAAGP